VTAAPWIDFLPLSRKRKNLSRNFSDRVMMAEVLHTCYATLFDRHSYAQGFRIDTKIYNWNALNQKVFKKIGVVIDATKPRRLQKLRFGLLLHFFSKRGTL
jgi:hypothetical protein